MTYSELSAAPLSGQRGTYSGNRWRSGEICYPLESVAKVKHIGGEIVSLVGWQSMAYATYGGCGLLGLDAATGDVLWRREDLAHHEDKELFLLPEVALLVPDGERNMPPERLRAIDVKSGQDLGWCTSHAKFYGFWRDGYYGLGECDGDSAEFNYQRLSTDGLRRSQMRVPWIPRDGLAFLGVNDWVAMGRDWRYVRFLPAEGKELEQIGEDIDCLMSYTDTHVIGGLKNGEWMVRGVGDCETDWSCDGRSMVGIPELKATGNSPVRLVMWDEEADRVLFKVETAPLSEELGRPDGTTLVCRSFSTGELVWAREFVSLPYRFGAWGAGGQIWVAASKGLRERTFDRTGFEKLSDEQKRMCEPLEWEDDVWRLIEKVPGRLMCLQATSGETLWEASINARNLVILGDHVVASTGSSLVCLRSRGQ